MPRMQPTMAVAILLVAVLAHKSKGLSSPRQTPRYPRNCNRLPFFPPSLIGLLSASPLYEAFRNFRSTSFTPLTPRFRYLRSL